MGEALRSLPSTTQRKEENTSWPGLEQWCECEWPCQSLSRLSLGGRCPRSPQRRHPWDWTGIKCANSLLEGTPVWWHWLGSPRLCGMQFPLPFGLQPTHLPIVTPDPKGHSPHHIHSSGAHLGVTAHNGHTGSKGAINTEDHKLCTLGEHGDVAVCKCVVSPGSQG